MTTLNRAILALSIFITPTLIYGQKPRQDVTGDYLLKTAWGGGDPFNKFTPDNHSLGCHSVAIAQALYYHRLTPFGNVNYKCSKGYSIEEDFSKHHFKWDSLIEKLNDSKKDQAIDETAKYLYFVAAAIQKDFGTDQYIKCDDQHKSEVESHFNCIYACCLKTFKSFSPDVFIEKDGFYSVIKNEIDLKRPLGFYYSNEQGSGHAVVIDGYVVKGEVFFVHANFGWKGESDGWYDLIDALPKDIKLVALLTIKPKTQDEKT
jgi:hypothetical protein